MQILSNNAVATGVGVYWMFYAGGSFEEVQTPHGVPGLKADTTVEGLRQQSCLTCMLLLTAKPDVDGFDRNGRGGGLGGLARDGLRDSAACESIATVTAACVQLGKHYKHSQVMTFPMGC